MRSTSWCTEGTAVWFVLNKITYARKEMYGIYSRVAKIITDVFKEVLKNAVKIITMYARETV